MNETLLSNATIEELTEALFNKSTVFIALVGTAMEADEIAKVAAESSLQAGNLTEGIRATGYCHVPSYLPPHVSLRLIATLLRDELGKAKMRGCTLEDANKAIREAFGGEAAISIFDNTQSSTN